MFISVLTLAQTPQLNRINENLFKSNVPVTIDYSYNFNSNTTVPTTQINTLPLINSQRLDALEVFVVQKDYSMIINRNPSIGIVNNPNNWLYKINTYNNLNYVNKVIK